MLLNLRFCHSEITDTSLQVWSSRTDEPPATGHPEPCEGSIMTCVGGHPDGFFTAFRMTIRAVHRQRGEKSPAAHVAPVADIEIPLPPLRDRDENLVCERTK